MNADAADEKQDALFEQAVALHQAGRNTEAEKLYRKILRRTPRHSGALLLLGVLAHQAGNHGGAVEQIEQALAVNPGFPEAWCNHGLALLAMRRYEDALASSNRALALRGDFPEAWTNRGACLHALGLHSEAVTSVERAIALRPEFAEAHNNRGLALQSLGRDAEALASYDRALELNPRYAGALRNSAFIRELLTGPEAAAESLRRAIELDPGDDEAPSGLLFLRQRMCAWEGLERDIDALRRRVTLHRSGVVSPFNFMSLPGTTPAEQRQCAELFAADRCARELAQPPLVTACPARVSGKRLKVAYLSADFREHAVSYLLAEVIELHDRTEFEVLGYSVGPAEPSPMRRRLEATFDRFRDVEQLTEDAAARLVLQDGVDILVDLTGYTRNNRAGIVARRPAPVQANWLGYPSTMGLPRMADYVIGDRVVTPPEHAAHFSEKLALLPHSFQPNDRRRTAGQRPSRAAVGLPDAGFVFCSFNQSYKITPAMFDRWCRIVGAVPNAVLWLLAESPAMERNLRREAARRGLAPERLVFASGASYSAHLGRLPIADLFLDTLPMGAGATASDALWMGLPIVTCPGETLPGRGAASLLLAAGLPELVTRTPEDYEALAVRLATQPGALGELRARLAATHATCPLFDAPRFTRDLERLYRAMWRNYLEGRVEAIILEPEAARP